jgi:lauroyl/myristoyl acyltransferase
VEHEGVGWLLPRGPFYLAMVAGAVCLPVVVVRLGQRRFSIRFFPPVVPPRTRDRQAVLDFLAKEWLHVLRSVICRHPDQWLVFENLVRPAANET